jgi:hypothetical protein
VIPVPIGGGSAYRPPALTPAVAAGRPVGELTCGSAGRRFAVHVELFAGGQAIVLPAGIGVARPFAKRLGSVVPGGCSYPLRTLTATGVVGVRRGATLRLRDLFRVWGQQLRRTQLASFSSGSPVRAYVGGKRMRSDAAAIVLRPGAEIVLELGAYVPPHRFFLFPKGPV